MFVCFYSQKQLSRTNMTTQWIIASSWRHQRKYEHTPKHLLVNSHCQSGSRGTRKRKMAILTDSPVKKQLHLQAEACKASSSGVGPRKRRASQSRVSKVRKAIVRDADNHCNSCGSQYGSKSDKRIKEQWFKFCICARWAHESCGNFDDKLFHCLPCIDSDSD